MKNDNVNNINNNIKNNIEQVKKYNYTNYTNNNTNYTSYIRKNEKSDINTTSGVIAAIVISITTLGFGLVILLLIKRNKTQNVQDMSNNSVKINISEYKKKPRKLSINHDKLSPKANTMLKRKPYPMHKKSFTNEIEKLKLNNTNNDNDAAIIKKMVERDVHNARVDYNKKLLQKKEFKPKPIKIPSENTQLNNDINTKPTLSNQLINAVSTIQSVNNTIKSTPNDTINPTLNVVDGSNNVLKPRINTLDSQGKIL